MIYEAGAAQPLAPSAVGNVMDWLFVQPWDPDFLSRAWPNRVRPDFDEAAEHDYLPPNLDAADYPPQLAHLQISRYFNAPTPMCSNGPHWSSGRLPARRDPLLYFYLPWSCPFKHSCPNAYCILSHTKAEMGYHPLIYKTKKCEQQLARHAADGPAVALCSYRHADESDVRVYANWAYLWEAQWLGWRRFGSVFLRYLINIDTYNRVNGMSQAFARLVVFKMLRFWNPYMSTEHCSRLNNSYNDLIAACGGQSDNGVVQGYRVLTSPFETRINNQPLNLLNADQALSVNLGIIRSQLSSAAGPLASAGFGSPTNYNGFSVYGPGAFAQPFPSSGSASPQGVGPPPVVPHSPVGVASPSPFGVIMRSTELNSLPASNNLNGSALTQLVQVVDENFANTWNYFQSLFHLFVTSVPIVIHPPQDTLGAVPQLIMRSNGEVIDPCVNYKIPPRGCGATQAASDLGDSAQPDFGSHSLPSAADPAEVVAAVPVLQRSTVRTCLRPPHTTGAETQPESGQLLGEPSPATLSDLNQRMERIKGNRTGSRLRNNNIPKRGNGASGNKHDGRPDSPTPEKICVSNESEFPALPPPPTSTRQTHKPERGGKMGVDDGGPTRRPGGAASKRRGGFGRKLDDAASGETADKATPAPNTRKHDDRKTHERTQDKPGSTEKQGTVEKQPGTSNKRSTDGPQTAHNKGDKQPELDRHRASLPGQKHQQSGGAPVRPTAGVRPEMTERPVTADKQVTTDKPGATDRPGTGEKTVGSGRQQIGGDRQRQTGGKANDRDAASVKKHTGAVSGKTLTTTEQEHLGARSAPSMPINNSSRESAETGAETLKGKKPSVGASQTPPALGAEERKKRGGGNYKRRTRPSDHARVGGNVPAGPQ